MGAFTWQSISAFIATLPAMSVERTKALDWERVRAVRRRALVDSPDAFGTTLEQHEAQSPEVWKKRLDSRHAATFLATSDGKDVGLITCATFQDRDLDHAGACGLFAMWVAPEVRGHGFATKLVNRVIEWARSRDYVQLILEVGDRNASAIRLYERCGFIPTGRTSTLAPPRTHIREHERALEL
jgi:GNAT superfamily N-acetyltransferase